MAVLVIAASGACVFIAPLRAAPPTVTPSPGYDARLQEQRRASSLLEPTRPVYRPVVRRHGKPRHAH
jgi:hypothetical protein